MQNLTLFIKLMLLNVLILPASCGEKKERDPVSQQEMPAQPDNDNNSQQEDAQRGNLPQGTSQLVDNQNTNPTVPAQEVLRHNLPTLDAGGIQHLCVDCGRCEVLGVVT